MQKNCFNLKVIYIPSRVSQKFCSFETTTKICSFFIWISELDESFFVHSQQIFFHISFQEIFKSKSYHSAPDSPLHLSLILYFFHSPCNAFFLSYLLPSFPICSSISIVFHKMKSFSRFPDEKKEKLFPPAPQFTREKIYSP